MAWRVVQCFELLCDNCAFGWEASEDQPHFATQGEGLEYATANGWLAHPDRTLCRDCTLVEACSIDGHEWDAWDSLGAEADQPRRFRVCSRCTAVEWTVALPHDETVHTDPAG